MRVDRRAARVAVALAAAPVVVNGLLALALEGALFALLGAVPVRGATYWVGVLNRTSLVVTVGVLLVASVAAFAVALPGDRDAAPVVAGFAVGAALYGVGVAAALAAAVSRLVVPPARFAVWLALLYGGAAALGAVAADAAAPLFRPPADADGDHPRW